jgi:hypothetical protein
MDRAERDVVGAAASRKGDREGAKKNLGPAAPTDN